MSAVASRPAAWSDIEPIVADLSDITAAEYRRLDIDPAALQLFAERAVLHQKAYTFHDEIGPLCVLGIRPEGNCLFTWFLASKRFFDLKDKTVFRFRYILREILEQNPGCTLDSRTTSRHPQTRRWFRLLGFSLQADDGDYLHFRRVE